MGFAVSAWFDIRTETLIRDLWRELADAGISRTLHEGPYRPHVTLATYESLDRPATVAALKQCLTGTPPFRVAFPALGVFLNGLPSVFLSVTSSQPLRQVHETVQDLRVHAAQGPAARYMPNAWNPHCTLAREIPGSSLPGAMALLSTVPLPSEGVIDRIGVIDSAVEVELDVVPLSSEGPHR